MLALGGVMVLVGCVAVVHGARKTEQQVRRILRGVVQRLGGRRRPRTFLSGPVWEVPGDGWDLRITYGHDPQGAQSVAITWVPHELMHVSIARERKADVRKLFRGEDLQIGAPRFDSRFLLAGNPPTLRAALGQEGRRAVHRTVGQIDATVRGGVVTAVLPGIEHGVDGVVERCERLMELGQILLEARSDRPGRLLHHVRNDPVHAVRRACLEQLLQTLPRSAAAAEARGLGAEIGHVDLQCVAALHRGEEGHATLDSLLTHPDLADDLRQRAVTALGRGQGGGLAVEEGAPGDLALEGDVRGAISRVKE